MSSTQLKLPASSRARTPAVIGATVLLAGAVAALQSSLAESALRGALILVLVPCAVIDVERRMIPNAITGPAAVAALVLGLAVDPGGELTRVAWAAGAGGFLLLTAVINPAGMGMGDVKLLAVMGLFLGPPVVIALLVGLLGSAVTGLVLARRVGVKAARKTGLPFGPYLALGGVVAALVGNPLVLSLLHVHG